MLKKNDCNMNSTLEVFNIGKKYKNRPVLRNVSLNVRRGEAVGLLGPNGAGKTTCFYCVTGLITPDYGDVHIDGQDITNLPMYRRARMGIGYLPLYAYYLSRPLYLLSVLVPASLLREFFALLVLTKIGLAGLFFAVFLRTAFRRNEPALVPFAMMYALCSFVAGYYWNIIWLDALALLPLMLAGMVSLLREGRFRLYTLALALSLLCNY